MTIPFAESLCSSFVFIESIVFNVLVLHKTPSGESQINLTGFVPKLTFLIDTLMPTLSNRRSITQTINKYCIKGAKTHIEEIPDILRIYNPEDVSV